MSQKIEPGPGVDCDEDGIVPASAEEAESETCPQCGGFAPEVVISECPSDDNDCDDDDHDFGLAMHVKEV